MPDPEPVHFFDLLSDLQGPSRSWSTQTLKVRAVLNFKAIPYTQSWISCPDIKPLITSLGLPPNAHGIPYTLPTILHKSSVTSHPSGALMDSHPIIMHLDNTFPSPPLFPSGDASYALLLAVTKITSLLEPAFRPMIVPRVAEHLDPRGREYFVETRSRALGKLLDQVRPRDEEGLERLWRVLESESAVLVGMLSGREGKKGPFFEGEVPGFADLLLACHLGFIERFDGVLFGRLVGLGAGEMGRLYEACRPWFEGQGVEREWVVEGGVGA
ncbi:hypothetical protein BO71DRAFT_230542 [Aspergillus ellipticus CBS 707.79]|uniref:Glutathione S-transferase UstS-like C-terminal domain-containing protein n=1 Tax=Aspergillus ellipticus CBS 707.79 TaxID=1448320 RepID=A0A319DB16_9EURO|nr:hypothetical protein BO71DRAFT_230542 [Aspergillus ellipticus CBS 707.79]